MQSPGSSTGDLTRREGAAWLAVLPLLLYLLLAGAGAWAGVYVTQFRVLSLVILVAVFMGWAMVAWFHPSARPRSRLAPILALIVTAQAIAAVLSPLPRLGLEYAGYTAILAGLYLLLVRLVGRPALARRIALVLAIVTLVVATLYLAVSVSIWIEWWSILGRLAVPPARPDYVGLMFGAPGILTAFIVCGAIASISILWPAGGRSRVLCIVLAIVGLVAVVVAAARSAWVALAVAGVVGGILVVLAGVRPTLPSSRRAVALTGAAAVVGVGLVVLVAPALARRIATGGGEDLRVSLAANALRLFARDPLTGGGPGQWVIARTSLIAPGEIDWYIPHAHNVPAQTLAESGLLGAVVAIVAVLATGALVIRAFRSGDDVRRSLAIGVAVIASYLAVHQLFDFFLDMPAILFAAVLPLAAIDAVELDARTRHPGHAPRRLVAIPALLAVVPLVLLIAVERASMLGEDASAAMPGNPGGAIALATQAADQDPEPTTYRWIRGLAEAARGDEAAALVDLESVAAQDDLPQAWLNVAWLRARLGDTDGARDALDRSLRTGQQQPAVNVGAVPVLLALGDAQGAEERVTAALLASPALADDPWWETSPQLDGLRAAAVERVATGSDRARAWQVALVSGDPERARTIAGELSPEERARAELVIDAWAGLPDGRTHLEAAAMADPLGPGPGWAALVAAREGDDATAMRFRRLAAIAYGSTTSDPGYDVVITTDPPLAQPPGSNAGFHFRYTYHRSVPANLLVPELPQVDLR